jgi:CelD/BcsL family acetyltransferase involved in cellulose biosynthesis
LELTAYNQFSLFNDLQPEWNDLLSRSASNRIFSTWEWQSTWWQAYEPGSLWVIACRDSDGKLIGLAPWFIENHAEKGRIICSIGCREVTDYLDIIADQAHTEEVLNSLTAYLREHPDQFDHIELCNIPEDSISYQNFPKILEQNGFTIRLTHEDVCPIIRFTGNWEDFLTSLDKKDRHELRRKIRRAEGVGNDMQWYIVGAENDLETEMERFLEMMAASSPDKTRFLSDPNNVRFFKSVSAIMHSKGWLQLIFLTFNGKHAAVYLNFDYNKQILVYNSGILETEFGHLSPGIVLLALDIKHAIETGHTVFDFLQGNEVYKYRMGGVDTHVYNLEADLSE